MDAQPAVKRRRATKKNAAAAAVPGATAQRRATATAQAAAAAQPALQQPAAQASAAPGGGASASPYDFPVREGATMDNGRYVLQTVVGKGSFGQVARATDLTTGELVAIKIVQARTAFTQQARKEIAMLYLLNEADPRDERFVVRLQRHFVEAGKWQCIVFEHLSYSLFDLLRNTSFQGISLSLVRKLTVQVLNAMDFLAKQAPSVVHCDIKPENVLLRHPTRSLVKLIDFGSSCLEGMTEYTYVQSRFYRSPEVMLGMPYGPGVDMWSLGCMMMELHSGEPLFGGRDESDQLWRIAMALGEAPQHILQQASHRKQKTLLQRRGGGEAAKNAPLELQPTNGHTPKACNMKPLATTLANARRRAVARVEARAAREASAAASGAGATAAGRPAAPVDSQEDYDAFLELVSAMLTYDPAERIKPDQALASRFIRGATSSPSSPVASSACGASGTSAGSKRKAALATPERPQADGTAVVSVPVIAPPPCAAINGLRRVKPGGAGCHKDVRQSTGKRY